MTDDIVRTQAFPAEGTSTLDIGVTVGRVDVALSEDAAEEVTVELRHDPAAQASWAEGVSNVLDWVNQRIGDQFGDLRGTPVEAVQQSRIEQTGNRVLVRGPKPLPLRNVPLSVTVTAPVGSELEIKAGAADVTVTGQAGRGNVATASGDIKLGQTTGALTVRVGSGAVSLGATASGLQVRSGSGDVDLAAPSGSATVGTGTGSVRVGRIEGELLARSGSGDLSVTDARSGSLELNTGSGAITVGIGSGVAAKIDVSSGSGTATSELPIADSAPSGDVALSVRARTGSGSATIRSAAH